MLEAAHKIARTARLMVLVTTTADVPRVPYTASPGALFGNDRAHAVEYAAGERARLDATGAVGWVWVGHDQFFYHTVWQWFHCFGPAGWESPQYTASTASQRAVEDMRAAKHAAERAEGEVRKLAARGAAKANGGKRKAKECRNMDAIVAAVAAQTGE